jgi:histidyl-tRNA synthetase
MRDFLPAEVRSREEVLATVRRVFESYGFAPLQTPAVERLEILQGRYGEEGDQLIFKIAQRGAKEGEEPDLALRYDLTVPLARVVAEYPGQLGRIFKRYQIAPVWRADRPARGRFREFYQCDVDVVGAGTPLADAEVVLVLTDALAAVGLKGSEVRVNSRLVLRGLIQSFGIDPSREAEVLTALDKLDKIGQDAVAEELATRGLAAATDLLEALTGRPDDLRVRLSASGAGSEGLEEVDRLTELVAPLAREATVSFSPALAMGLGYYTGPIFEVYIEGSASAIASGGRYDGLIGMFAGRDVPAVGGSLGIERIIPLVEAAEQRESPATVLVTVWDEGSRPDDLATASELRAAGIPTEVYLGEDRVGEQLGYAASRGIPLAVLRGPRERDQGLVTVRDLRTRKQASVTEAELAGYLKQRG